MSKMKFQAVLFSVIGLILIFMLCESQETDFDCEDEVCNYFCQKSESTGGRCTDGACLCDEVPFRTDFE
ncbi:unnamed protein product [Callosobruchus maculatus]|uniref:Invertebrate defensins family profile domain-containing protein n=1 Tax=Callosobruchus maculatus TaxID=64391 RepID=A0A653BIE9_CALMS|nr:unnamed protein product [Callosobruchus maculatus]